MKNEDIMNIIYNNLNNEQFSIKEYIYHLFLNNVINCDRLITLCKYFNVSITPRFLDLSTETQRMYIKSKVSNDFFVANVSNPQLNSRYESIIKLEDEGCYSVHSIDFEKYPELFYHYYEGSKYYGPISNPYKILVSALADADGNVVLHEDTKTLAQSCFYGYYINNENYGTLNSIEFNKSFDGDITALRFVSVKNLIINGSNSTFLTNSLEYVKNTVTIVAPSFELNQFKDKEIKNLIIAGYLKNLDLTIKLSPSVLASYEKYLNKSYKNLFISLKNKYILNYVLNKHLINSDNILDLIANEKDDTAKRKLIEYKNLYCEFKNYEEIVKQYFDEQLEIIKNSDKLRLGKISTELNSKNNNLCAAHDFIVDRKYKRKYHTFWRKLIKKGDCFVAKYKDEVMIIEIEQVGNSHNYEHLIKIISPEECSKTNILDFNEPGIVFSKNGLVLKEYKDSIIYKSLCAYSWSFGKIYLSEEIGLFKHINFNGKYIELPNSNDLKENVTPKKLMKLFEPYFVICAADDINNLIVFRKIFNKEDLINQVLNVPNQLSINAFSLKSSLLYPFVKYDDLNLKYINDSNLEYNFIDVFNHINHYLTVGDRSTNKTLIISYFSEFYQQNKKNKLLGFSSKEIEIFLDKYFICDYVLGFYYGWDTVELEGNELFAIDKTWFKVLYDTVRKYKNEDFKTTDDVEQYIKNNQIVLFKKYSIKEKYLDFFVKCARHIDSFEQYIENIKPYIKELLKIIETLDDNFILNDNL